MTTRDKTIATFILFSCLAGAVLGQIAGGFEGVNTQWGGNNFIVGTVFWPTGRRVDVRLGLRLRSLTRNDILGTTDDSGRFIFSHLPAGYYEIIIEGEKEFEPVTQSIEINHNREGIPQSYSMSIRLVDKIKPVERAKVINVDTAGVPKRAFDLYMKAGELAKNGDSRGGIKQLELAIAEYPAFMNAYNEMGAQYLKLNELEKATEALTAALKIKPDAFEPLVNRGIALFRIGRHSDSEQSLRDALKLKVSAVARYYLGRALIKLGRNEEAEKELKTAIETGEGEFKEAHRLLASIYFDRGNRAEVVKHLETYLRLVPNAPDAAELRTIIEQSRRSAGATPAPKTLR